MHKSGRSKKADIADKVREIKHRQQNWLKQRAASQQQESTDSKPDTQHYKQSNGMSANSASSRSTGVKTLTSASHINRSTQRTSYPPEVIASKKSSAKFHNWMKAREQKEGSDEEFQSSGNNNQYDSRQYTDGSYGNHHYQDKPYRDHVDSSEVNVLRVASSRSPQYASPDPDWGSDDETGEITAAQLMSPQDFESVADNIIAKVKGELRVKETSSNVINTGKPYPSGYTNQKHGEGSGNTELSSHVCPGCSQLMLPPKHVPMLLIPCGHTLCGQCSGQSKFCHLCGCPVQSSTANIMLQHIITDFQVKAEKQNAKREESKRQRVKYREEYRNLQMRQDVLREESEEISHSLHQVSCQLRTEHQQVDKITAEEQNVQQKIAALQDKLQGLVSHRRQYEQSCETLEKQSKSEQQKLSLVQDTLRSIQGQIEKIKLLAEADH